MTSNNVQTLDSITNMADSDAVEPKNALGKEYAEGKQYLENKSYGQAAASLHNALIGFEEKNNQDGVANASNQLGHLCLAKKDYPNALKHYQRTLKICDASYDRMSMLAVLHKIHEVQEGMEDYSGAIESCLDMLDHYHDNRDPQGTVEVLEKMAGTYDKQGLPEKAADAYKTISAVHKNYKHNSIAKKYSDKAAALKV